MSPIELTDLHKSRLLEMCRVLFPEYNRIEISDYQIDVDRNHYNPIFIDIYKGDLTVPFDIYSTHWFEFCMTKLVDKLYDSINYTDSDEFNINLHVDLMLDMVNFKINPIDTLYKEFLKTKTSDK